MKFFITFKILLIHVFMVIKLFFDINFKIKVKILNFSNSNYIVSFL